MNDKAEWSAKGNLPHTTNPNRTQEEDQMKANTIINDNLLEIKDVINDSIEPILTSNLVFIILILCLIVIIFILVVKLFVKFRSNVGTLVNKGSDYNNRFDIDIESGSKGSKDTKRQQTKDGTYRKQSDGRRVDDSFGTKMSKTSDALESIPESSQERVQPLSTRTLSRRYSNGTDCSATDSVFSDTFNRMETIIDQTFDSIIDGIDNNKTHHYSSDDD